MEKKKDEEKIVEQLRELFDAESEHYIPDKEEVRLIEERDKLEQETALSFKIYVENYERLQEYGLDQKLLKQLEWFILFYLENRREEFLRSEFYKRFRNSEVVQRAEMEYERKNNLQELVWPK